MKNSLNSIMLIIFKCFPHTISCNPLIILISPPLCGPSALLPTGLFSESASLGFYSLVCCHFYAPHVRDTINYLYFSVLLISLMFSKFIHVVANKTSFFLWLSSIPLCACLTSLFIHMLVHT